MAGSPDVFTVLANPTRRDILALLTHHERSVGELVDVLGTAQPNVSKHLKALGGAGLVRFRVDGPSRHYALVPDRLRELDAWLAPFREIWADRLDALTEHLDAMPDSGPYDGPDDRPYETNDLTEETS
ncbi:DNA-binding transcriptional ArsR family regulator [Mumia flava]|uniref:DNA-binding transcriptional ArsR family regulator n=1 Tax=Mumia flava TaxID=1348852 RepID=A0A2M9B796_9ACTN|nr:metalloregulator ArsR/SmtB family transcription factor [Mumia flava]PJJ53802.1 DNA-binding transcriptional ArsR family regulator [Mumia flava]